MATGAQRVGTQRSARHRLLPLLVLTLCLVATGVLVHWSRRQQLDELNNQRAAQLDVVRADVSSEIDQYTEVLHGIKGLFEASTQVTRAEFGQYLVSSGALRRLSGLQALEWAPVVRQAEVASFERAVIGDTSVVPTGYPAFTVTPRTGAGDLVVVNYVEPMVGNDAAFGFDLASNPVRAASIEAATSSGRPVATAPITLVQETESQAGFLILLRVDRPQTDPAKPELAGFVLAVFRVDDLLADANSQDDISFVVTALGSGNEADDSTIFPSTDPPSASSDNAVIDVAGQQWRIALSEADTAGLWFNRTVLTAALAGIVTSSVLAFATNVLQHARVKAERHAAQLTVKLRHSNDQLTTTSRRLTDAVSAGNIGLWERDVETGESWLSEEFAALYNCTTEHWAGPESLIERLHPEDRREQESQLRAEPKPNQIDERHYRIRGPDGTYRWIRARSQLLERADGGSRMVGASIDITAERDREAAVARLNSELTEANQDLGDFVRVMSHDLRSPLRGIQTLINFIEEDAGDRIPNEARGHLDKIDGRVARMQQLLDDLQDYAQAGRSSAGTGRVNPIELSQEIFELLNCPEGISLVVESDIGSVTVDRNALATCVRNLVDNAIKHHDGPPGTITVRFRRSAGHVSIEVQDDGPGIAEQYLDQIFQPFRTLQSRDQVEGSGIGLAIVRRTTERAGGRVDVATALGHGSTFRLLWPEPNVPTYEENNGKPAHQPAHR